ncbi:MAG: phage Gp19/Gp15/Gp42 family protein [Propionibacteriaceae bacterium]|jgi:hypothetical protein|nr:phage Gp19/Gp15/Gp42 family protein [Propionibacteriaceae bacterium]
MVDIDWAAEIEARAEPGLAGRFPTAFLARKAIDAAATIADMFPNAARRLKTGELSETTYRRIVCDAVLRQLRNPEGHRSESDGVYQYTASQTVASGDLWIPDKDKALLQGPVSSGAPGSFGVGTDRGWGR